MEIAPDSELVRDLHRLPLASDLFTLLVARETLEWARDRRAVTALDAHLTRLALAALAGTPPQANGTVGDLAASSPGLTPADREAISTVLSSSLRASLVQVEGIDLVVAIENASAGPIRAFEAVTRVAGPGRDPILLTCERMPETERALAPGESRPRRCEVFGNRYGLADHFRSLRAQAGAALPLEVRYIRFGEPAFILSPKGATWSDREAAHQRALLDMRKLPCERRGACADDLRKWIVGRPHYVAGAAGALAGLVVGVLVGAFGRRRALGGSIASIGAGALAVGAFFVVPTGGWAGLLLFVLAAAALGGFLAALWLTLAIFGAVRKPL